MAQPEPRSHANLYPVLQDSVEDEELEQVKQLSLITAQEDEIRRRYLQNSSAANDFLSGCNSSSITSQPYYNDVPVKLQPNGLQNQGSRPTDAFNTATNRSSSTSNRPGPTIVRPRPAAVRDIEAEQDSKTLARPKPLVPKPPVKKSYEPSSLITAMTTTAAAYVGSHVASMCRTLERNMSDPMFTPTAAPRPVPTSRQRMLTPEPDRSRTDIASKQSDIIAVPSRPTAKPSSRPSTPISSQAPRCQSVPLPYLGADGRTRAAEFTLASADDCDFDPPLIKLSPPKTSWIDDISQFDPCRPDSRQPPLVPPSISLSSSSSAGFSTSKLQPSMPSSDVQKINPGSQSAPVYSQQHGGSLRPSFSGGGILSSVQSVASHVTPLIPSSIKSGAVQVLDWSTSMMPVARCSAGSSSIMIGDDCSAQSSPACLPTQLQPPLSNLMEFAESQWDPQYMSLEDFDPLYSIVPSRQHRSDSIDLFPSHAREVQPLTVVATATVATEQKPAALSAASVSTAVNSSTSQVPSPPAYWFSPDLPFNSIDELQDPFSLADLTLNLEKKRQQHEREEQLRRAAVAAKPPAVTAAITEPPVVGAGRSSQQQQQQRRFTQSIKYPSNAQESSSYEMLQDLSETSTVDEETREFLELVARVKLLHNPSDPETNRGIVISPQVKHTPYYDLSVKVCVSAIFLTEPVIFTCDVNSLVQHVVSHVLLTVVDNLESTSTDDYLLKVHGLSEYVLNDAILADYGYVQQCLKLDRDIKFILCELDSISKPFLRTEADSSHPVFAPKPKQIGDPAIRVTRNKLNILMETFYKVVEKLRDSAVQASVSGSTSKVNCSGVVQAVKAICTILHQLETVDITKTVQRLKSVVRSIDDDVSNDGSTVRPDTTVTLDDLHVTLEELTRSVKSMIEMFCRAFHTDYRFESVVKLLRDIRDTSHLHESLLVHVATAHRIPDSWKTLHVDYRIICSLYYGGVQLTRDAVTQPKIASSASTIVWDEWLIFETVLISSLPREAKLIFSLIGSRLVPSSTNDGHHKVNVSLGWVSMQLYNQSFELVQGSQLLGLWPGDPIPLGTTSSSTESPNSVLLQVNLPVFDFNYEFPAISDPLPSVKEDFSSLHPEDQEYLLAIIEKDALTRLTNDESDYLWEKRHYLYDKPRALPRVLQTVNTWAWSSLAETYTMIQEWAPMQPLEALQLLLPSYADTFVRKKAVDQLAELSPDELYDLLPQLVQALKFECYHTSALTRLLLDRAGRNVRVAHNLYWLFKEAADDPRYRKRYQLMFGALLSIVGNGMRTEMTKQEELIKKFSAIADKVKAARDKDAVLERELVICWDFLQHSSIRLPLNPSLEITGIDVKSCSYFTSFTCPLKLCLKNIDIQGGDIYAMFKAFPPDVEPAGGMFWRSQAIIKHTIQLRCMQMEFYSDVYLHLLLRVNRIIRTADHYRGIILGWCDRTRLGYQVGDDLRQDMLTLQMVRIMDKMWMQEGLDLKMITFTCQPTSLKHGLVELVMESDTLRKIQVKHGHGLAGSFKDRPIAEWLQGHNPTELDYQKAVDNFTASTAGYCVATYILGICDRHNDNIMIKHSGHIFHIDFAKFLGDAQMFGNIKRDRTPFVLTSDMAYVINGGDKPTQKFQQFVDLCCRAFNIIRKNANLFLNLFSLMTLSGIPGVNDNAPKYIQRVLLPDRTDAEAVADFTRMINVSLQSIFTQFNFFLHNLAQMKFIGHDEGVLLSFMPKTYSIHTDGRIIHLEMAGIQKRYSPEKFYSYIVKVERENQRIPSYVLRRYSEFQELHRKLVLAFPLVHLPSLSNKIIVGRAHVRTVAEARRVELEVFINELLKPAPEISQHDLIYTFFHPILRDEQDVDKTNILKLRDAGATSSTNNNSNAGSIEGAIKLNLFYRGDSLTVMVMHIKSLGPTVTGDAPNPYVKLYLLPDPTKLTKRKTKIAKSTFHPTYNEMLMYRASPEVLKHKTLQVTVWSYEAVKENEFLGAVHIRLSELDLSNECTAWHKLQTLHSLSLSN